MITGFLIGFLILNFYFHFYRIEKARKEVTKVLDKIDILCKQDIYRGLDWKWRCGLFETIPLWKIIYSFKPVESFYKNHKCLEKRENNMEQLKGHGILKCKICGKIIIQCRCPCREIQYTVCNECKFEEEK